MDTSSTKHSDDGGTESSNERTFRSPWILEKGTILGLGLYFSVKLSWAVLLFLSPWLLSRPRKIKIAEDGVIYWPRFGRPKKYTFSCIKSISRGTIYEKRFTPAAKCEVTYSPFPEIIPLDLNNHKEVLALIIDAWQRYRAAHGLDAA